MERRVITGGGAMPGAGALAALLRRQAAFRPRVMLVLLCLALWLPGLFSLPPGDRDESRFAQASKQMNETGDYVRIMNGTVPRNRKPIGIYWLQASAALAAGPNLANPIWPYRIPSLLGGILAVLATFQAGLVLTPARRTAAYAGAMLAACVLLTAETHIAKTDAVLLGVTTLAMAVLARAWMGAPVSRGQAAVFWLAAAAGILVKGPVTPMVLGLATATLCLWERRAGWLAPLRASWGAPLMAAAVLPWFAAIGVATGGGFFKEAVGADLGAKLAGGVEAHGAPPGMHLLLLPLLTFPSTLPVLAGLAAAWQRRREAATRFMAAWLIPAWLVFEAVPTKLPHYPLPLYPAVFLLAACALDTPWAAIHRWARAVGLSGLSVATVAAMAAAVALPWLLHGPLWLGLPAACGGAVTGWLAAKRRLVWALCAAIPLYTALLGVELPNLRQLWIAPRVVSLLRTGWAGYNPLGRGLAVAGYAEPSLMFMAGSDMKLLYSGAQAAAALNTGAASAVLVSDRERDRFVAAAQRIGLPLNEHGAVDGFNASRGRWVTLSLFSRACR